MALLSDESGQPPDAITGGIVGKGVKLSEHNISATITTLRESHRMSGDVLEPIPWVYTETPSLVLWTWHTPHFVAKVVAVEAQGLDVSGRPVKAYQWEIGDLLKPNQGMPRFLMEGMTNTFREAEMAIRENIGKSYSIKYGYQRYAGSLATTFTIATGESIDFGVYRETDSIITVQMPDGTERKVNGVVSVHHYKLRVKTQQKTLEVRPEHVLAIQNASSLLQRAAGLKSESKYSGIGRIYNDDWRPGCSGAPGFTAGSVDHAGAPLCPIHEQNANYHRKP